MFEGSKQVLMKCKCSLKLCFAGMRKPIMQIWIRVTVGELVLLTVKRHWQRRCRWSGFANIMCWQENFEGVAVLPYAAEWQLDA